MLFAILQLLVQLIELSVFVTQVALTSLLQLTAAAHSIEHRRKVGDFRLGQVFNFYFKDELI